MVEERDDDQEYGEALPLARWKRSQSIGHDVSAVLGEVREQTRVAAALAANALLKTQAVARIGQPTVDVPSTEPRTTDAAQPQSPGDGGDRASTKNLSSSGLLTTQAVPQGNPTTELLRTLSNETVIPGDMGSSSQATALDNQGG